MTSPEQTAQWKQAEKAVRQAASSNAPGSPTAQHQALWLARLLDSMLDHRILVLGPFPPPGRDLDVLARRPQRQLIDRVLTAEGLLPRGSRMSPARIWVSQWARFAGSSTFAIDVHPPERWRLPPSELAALFCEAKQIEGMRHLARCAPQHVLLLTARSWIATGGPLGAKRRGRVERAVAEDARAWELAGERAPAWGLERGLSLLRAHERQVPRRSRALARAGLLVTGDKGPLAAKAARRAARMWPVRTRIVSLSGIDGAGKSSQAHALHGALANLGAESVIEWRPLGYSPRNPILRVIRRSVSRGLQLAPGSRARPAGTASGAGPSSASNPARALRERSRVVTQVWATIVALVQALQHRRAALRHAGRGKIVIFDRYMLDACAQLRYFYGPANEFRFQKWLIRAVSPKPSCSYLLDVAPEKLMRRKELQYSLEEVRQQVRLYRDEAPRVAVRQLDGERPVDELSEEIARDVWRRAG